MVVYDLFLSKEWLLAHRHLNLWPDWSEYFRIRSCYSSSSRFYHTWKHIYATCRFVRSHFGFQPLVILALFYHDIVYDVKRKDNEVASALEWQRYAQSRGLVFGNAAEIQLVSDLIVMTEKHQVEKHQPESFAIMCDADMSIFLAPEQDYHDYSRDIWREYSCFGRQGFVAGRTKFLQTVEPESMFYTAQAKALVQAARNNLDWERRTLGTDPHKILV